jgi:transposase
MAATAIRERRRTLRYRNLLVRQMVQRKNKISGLLREAGVNYNQQRRHKAGYFRGLLATNPDIAEGRGSLLRLCRETVVRLQKTESALVRSRERDSLLVERVERRMTIPGVGPITALTWVLEVGEVQRFSSIISVVCKCLLRCLDGARETTRSWLCSMTGKNRKAMPIVQRWQWHESGWPI